MVACAGVSLNAWLPLARRSSIASAIFKTQSGSSGPNFSMCSSRSIECQKCLSPLSCGSVVTFPAFCASSSSDVWIRLTTESRLKNGKSWWPPDDGGPAETGSVARTASTGSEAPRPIVCAAWRDLASSRGSSSALRTAST
jgi:hypothetical protein